MDEHLTHLVVTTQHLLATRYGVEVSLRSEHVVMTAKSVVIRVAVADAPAHLPPTLIVKQPRPHGTSVDTSPLPEQQDARARLLNEWAACALLRTIPCEPPLAPQVYAADVPAGILVLEDLGDVDGATTTDPLAADNPAWARTFLLESVRSLAQLHGLTMPTYDRYCVLRRALGPLGTPPALFTAPWVPARLRAVQRTERHRIITAYQRMRGTLSLAPATGIESEVAWIVHAVEARPGPFLALCQGDQHLPGRLLASGALPRRFDFDQAGFRHAFLEGMPGRLTWGCMLRIPPPIIIEMEHAYRDAIQPYCPAVADISQYQQALLAAGGHWHLFHTLHRLPAALAGDAPRGPSSRRQQNLAWQDAFVTLSDTYAGLPALRQSAGEIAARLRRLWLNVEPLPYYPAFIPHR
jgi:hypothetical protein